jgi:hypothetical protein
MRRGSLANRVEDLMPLDATQAALIGAEIGAAATTAGSALTPLVTRRDSYAQHLYVKRAEVYEDLPRVMATWMDKSPTSRPRPRSEGMAPDGAALVNGRV